MRRAGRHKVKKEQPETSFSASYNEERDLAHYIHDRVELMHQVFTVLKTKEIKAMAPQCVQYISINDLQELCTEELLGISSKRLCSILDGADPPSDTESSSSAPSPEKLETISLDSISSDEEILSESNNKKKKHKHRHHSAKSKHKRKSTSDASDNNEDRSKASRAGLTVLELLELQARARAIRAQLQQEQTADAPDTASVSAVHRASDDEVEIKEEPPEVVEISSGEDEKPKIAVLQNDSAVASKNSTETSNQITKRVNDLIVILPQTKPTRKIKLNRNKGPVSVINAGGVITEINKSGTTQTTAEKTDENTEKKSENSQFVNKTDKTLDTVSKPSTVKDKQKKKQKKKEKGKSKTKEGSDHDEITLQLSDTEKMDLLEDLDRKNYDKVSSSSTEDSESSSDTSATEEENLTQSLAAGEEVTKKMSDKDHDNNRTDDNTSQQNETDTNKEEEYNESKEIDEKNLVSCETKLDNAVVNSPVNQDSNTIFIETTTVKDIPLRNDNVANMHDLSVNLENSTITQKYDIQNVVQKSNESESNRDTVQAIVEENTEAEGSVKENKKELSDGEISDHESSDVEASELKPEVVCISDEEVDNKKAQKKRRIKKKEKKAKKEKKSKKAQDFHNGADENFYRDTDLKVEASDGLIDTVNANAAIDTGSCANDDVYEILELSSDSSCNEEEGNSVLSKEPTTAEIEALSAKIDEIEREDVVTAEEITEHELSQVEKRTESDIENISWKDRYLESKKVKNVLTTANIFNALRKKNKELKKKLEESKKIKITVVQEVEEKTSETNMEEGSIEHYNTLEGSTKYVDPVSDEKEIQGNEESENKEGKVTKEMKKDAKQLLKMYKKLLKYNDVTRQSDPNRKKKKKQKKNKEQKEKDGSVTSDMGNTSLQAK